MRSRKSKFNVNSKLKSYINGDIKLQDFRHPSKLQKRSNSRNCIFSFCPRVKQKSVFQTDPLLKRWNRKIESRLKAYIQGQVSIKELIHPSKLKQLTEEELKQKVNNYKILRSNSQRLISRRKKHHWVTLNCNLGRKKLKSKKKISVNSKLGSSKSIRPKKGKPKVKADKNTLILNGNLNILCLNIDSTQKKELCHSQIENMQETLKNIKDCIPVTLETADCKMILEGYKYNVEKSVCLHAGDNGEISEYRPLGTPNPNMSNLVKTVNKLESTLDNMNQNYFDDFNKAANERKLFYKYQEICDKTINRLTKEIKAVENEKAISEMKVEGLTDEIKMLRDRIQMLLVTSANRMKQLNNEILVLEGMNKYLENSSDHLHKEIGGLKEQNQNLANILSHKQRFEEQLKITIEETKGKNKILESKLHQEITKNTSKSKFKNSNKKVQVNMEDIEREFDIIFSKVKKSRLKSDGEQNNSKIVDTITTIHKDYCSLKGQVRYFPEKLKKSLMYVSNTITMLQEQNRRLMRALAFTDSEQLSGNECLQKIKNI